MSTSPVPTGPTRRSFIKLAATGVSATLAGISLARAATAGGSDRIRVGLIGCGGRGTGAAKNALSADPGVHIVALCDLFADRLAWSLGEIKAHAPERVDVPAARQFVGFDGYRAVIDACDVVLIACASRFHPLYTRTAIDAGKHVFVEKPHGIDPVGIRATQEAADLARQKGLSCVSGLHNRFDSGVRETIARIRDGAIGDIVSVEVNYLREPYVLVPRQPGWSEIENQYRNWYHFSWLSGDDVPQSLVHNLDKICWLFNEEPPVRAHGLAGRSSSFAPIYGNCFDHHSVVYEWASGVRVYAMTRTQVGTYGNLADYVVGTKGRASLLEYKIRGETNWDFAGKNPNPYQLEMDEMFAGIRAGKPLNSGAYMANSTMVTILGQLACYTGRSLGWKKVAASKFAYPPHGPVDFNTRPPVELGADGIYPVPVPGLAKAIADL